MKAMVKAKVTLWVLEEVMTTSAMHRWVITKLATSALEMEPAKVAPLEVE